MMNRRVLRGENYFDDKNHWGFFGRKVRLMFIKVNASSVFLLYSIFYDNYFS